MIQEVKAYIQDDYLEEAMKLLLNSISNKEWLKEIIIYQGRLSSLNTQIRMGVIDFNETNLEKNKIRRALLELLEQINHGKKDDTNLSVSKRKFKLLLKQLELLNSILFRLIYETLGVYKSSEILNYRGKPLKYMPKELKEKNHSNSAVLIMTYNVLFKGNHVQYYNETMGILSKMAMENEQIFNYYIYVSRFFMIYREAINGFIPWYFICLACADPDSEKNILIISNKILTLLNDLYLDNDPDFKQSSPYLITHGHGYYDFYFSQEGIKELSIMLGKELET